MTHSDLQTRLKTIAIKQDAFLQGEYDWTNDDSKEYDLLTRLIRQAGRETSQNTVN